MLRIILKNLILAVIIAFFFFITVPASLLILDFSKRMGFYMKVRGWCSRWILSVLNIDVEKKNLDRIRTDRNYLIVSNHLSYADTWLISMLTPTLFVTSREVRNTPFLGWVAALCGTVFVERRNPSQLKDEITRVAGFLKKGFNICVFPEATSTNGLEVKPFKTALLDAAKIAGTDILPVCLRYTEINGYPAGPENLDNICYYGTMYFLPHLLKMTLSGSFKGEISVLKAVSSADQTRKDLGKSLRERIQNEYFSREFAKFLSPHPKPEPAPSAEINKLDIYFSK